jgi:hypothetical protein
MENMAKPSQLCICLVLMVVSVVYGLFDFVAFQIPFIAVRGNVKINELESYIISLIVLFPFGFLVYKIYKARAWARMVWSLLIIFGFFVSLSFTFDYEKYPVILAFIGTILAIAEIIILVLLWNPATTRWFKAMKAARLAAPEVASAETSESDDNTYDDLQTVADSTISAPETMHGVMSYNKLLKILRVIRVIYILIITHILINIAAFYQLAINSISRFPMSQNTATLINVDRAVSLALLVILLISFGYIIIEYLFDKKLQSYPQELIDQSYSKKAILFLSFLYIFFFFSLNNWIVIDFLISSKYRIIYLVLMNLVVIYFVYRLLIQKIENKKTWRNFWIAAVFFLPFMTWFVGFSEFFFIRCGTSIFSKPVLFIINTLKSIFGAAS